ncbi:MAG: glycosyltransferase family 4 protein [Thermoanaerobaculia bacterium]
MKIVFLEPSGKGAMIHYSFQLCRGLAANGADVTLITATDYELAALHAPFRVEPIIELWDPKPPGRVSTAPWAVAWRKLRRIGRAVRYYREWLRQIRRVAELQPDVVMLGDVRFPFDLFPLMLLRRKAQHFVNICHNVHPFTAGGAFRRQEFFYKRIYRLFDFVFVHFERNRAEFLQSFDVDPKRVGVIVHGNEDIFRELRTLGVDAIALRQRIGLRTNDPIVLFFGTLTRYKGVDVLIDAFARVQKETGARLVLAGFPFHDFDVAAHQEQTRRLGIAEHVTWVPEYIDSGDIAAWMELTSVIVFPYRDIYQSGALHVAQTFGVPTIATAIGAMQDVIEDGVSGLLVPPNDADALADALRKLLTDRNLAERLGATFLQDAHGRFAWKAIGRTIIETLGAPASRAG